MSTWTPPSSGGGVTNAVQSGGLLGNLNEGLFVPTTATAFGANDIHLVRFICPQTGTLHDVGVFVDSQSGNVSLAVYDTGDATAGTLTRLATSGAVACAAANTWQTFDPAIAVTQGQQIMLALSCDNNSASFATGPNPGSAYWTLPAGYLATAAAARRVAARAVTSHPAPATIADASLTTVFFVEYLIARIA